MSKLAETIVFDIIDELTDVPSLQVWFDLDEKKQHEITGKLVGIVDHNINLHYETLKSRPSAKTRVSLKKLV